MVRTFIIAIGLLTYINSLDNPLLFDDQHLLLDNNLLTDAQSFTHILSHRGMTSSPVFAAHYRPLLMITYWLNVQFNGLWLPAFRLTNLALHLVCAVLIGFLCSRMLTLLRPQTNRAIVRQTGPIAMAIFTLHPIYSESVNQILKRNSSLATTLILISLILFLSAFNTGRQNPTKSFVTYWVSSVIVAALALFAKEDAVVMPLLIALCGWQAGWWRGRISLAIAMVASYTVIPLVYLICWPPSPIISVGESSPLRHFFAQPAAIFDYLSMLVFPSRIPIASGLAPASWPPSSFQIAGIGVIFAFIVAAFFMRRRMPLFSFTILWAFICLAPSSSFFPLLLVADPIRVYLASLGLVFSVAIALAHIGQWLTSWLDNKIRLSEKASKLTPALPAVLVSLWLSLGTLQVNANQSDGVQAWSQAVALYPEGKIPNANLCNFMVSNGQLKEAIRQCRRAQSLSPKDPWVVSSLITAQMKLGYTNDAEQELQRAKLLIGAAWPLALVEGHIAWFKDELQRADGAYSAVLQINPGHAQARTFLADVKLRLGMSGAKDLIEPIYRYPPSDPLTRQLFESVKQRVSH